MQLKHEAMHTPKMFSVFLYYNVISDNTLAFEIAVGSLDITVTLHTDKRKQINVTTISRHMLQYYPHSTTAAQGIY